MVSNSTGHVRIANESDIPKIRQIYDVHTSNITSVVSFEEETPSVKELTVRWKSTQNDNLPFFVYEIDESVVGYAYAMKFRSRPAYLHTVEDSVYVSDAYQNRGIGKALLLRIINKCKESGVRCIVAVLGTEQDNPGSVILHRKAGFREVGTLHDVGHKNGKWIDRLLMEYIIM